MDEGVGLIGGVEEVCDGLLSFGGSDEVEVFSGSSKNGVEPCGAALWVL